MLLGDATAEVQGRWVPGAGEAMWGRGWGEWLQHLVLRKGAVQEVCSEDSCTVLELCWVLLAAAQGAAAWMSAWHRWQEEP